MADALPVLLEELGEAGQDLVLILEDYHLADGPPLAEPTAGIAPETPPEPAKRSSWPPTPWTGYPTPGSCPRWPRHSGGGFSRRPAGRPTSGRNCQKGKSSC